MGKIETATQWMENAANNPAVGYDQQYRWGERGDFDCSSAVITAWKTAGLTGITATYTGNIYRSFIANGFSDVTDGIDLANGSGLVRGDVLLNHSSHVAMWTGRGTVEASINEFGGVTGGTPGDQTGTEFVCDRPYRNYPWDCVLRYTAENTDGKKTWKATGTAVCTENGVNLRQTPAGTIVGALNAGQRFEIDGQTDRGWTHAYVAGVGVCWIYSAYVLKDASKQTTTWKATGTATIVSGVDASDPVNVRATPGGDVIGSLISGQRFEIDGSKSDGWWHVNVAGIGIGWVYGIWCVKD